MKTYRKNAIVAGILYITGTVSGILSVAVSTPVRNANDLITGLSSNGVHIIIGAIFILVMGLSLAMMSAAVYPVLKKHNAVLALGYVVFRGGLETVCYMAMTVSWLMLLPLSKIYQSGMLETAAFNSFGKVLIETNQIFSVSTIVFLMGAVMFYFILYRSKLVPLWLSAWGLIAIIPYLTTCILGMFSVINTDMSSDSSIHSILVFPLALQEMVLAAWLIIKGFNKSAIESLSTEK
jgi:hypothetical protein